MKPYRAVHPVDEHSRTDTPHVPADDHEPRHASGPRRHMLLMLLACIGMVAAIVLLAGGTAGRLDGLLWLILLLCPLMHLFMHRGHGEH